MKKLLMFFLIFSTTAQLMSQTKNKQRQTEEMQALDLLDAFANAFNAHNAERIVSYMTDDCIFQASAGPDVDGERFVGKEAVKKAFDDIFKNFPDAKWNGPRHFIAGERAVSEWTFTGTKVDGSKVEVTGCDIFTLREGKIFIKNSYRKNRPALTR